MLALVAFWVLVVFALRTLASSASSCWSVCVPVFLLGLIISCHWMKCLHFLVDHSLLYISAPMTFPMTVQRKLLEASLVQQKYREKVVLPRTSTRFTRNQVYDDIMR